MNTYFWGDGNGARQEAAEVAAEQEVTEAQREFERYAAEVRARNAEIDRLNEAVIRLDDLLDAEMDIFAAP